MSEQRCGTCAFAKFELTPTGRIKQKHAGRCEYPSPEFPPLPDAITKAYGFVRKWHRNSIWPEYGTACPCYQRKETK